MNRAFLGNFFSGTDLQSVKNLAVSFLVLFLYVSLPNICKYTKNIFKTKINIVKKTKNGGNHVDYPPLYI